MIYNDVLDFVIKLLNNSHIPSNIIEEGFEDTKLLDLGLRDTLYSDSDKDKSEIIANFFNSCKENTLYYLTDRYYCSYTYMKLPNAKENKYFIIGPYTYVEFTRENYLELLAELDIPLHLQSALEQYYFALTFVNSETQFKNLITTLADTIFGGGSSYTVTNSHSSLFDISDIYEYTENSDSLYLLPANISAVESRYVLENKYMQAVSQGNHTMIDQLIMPDEGLHIPPRLSDSLRDYKNYMIIFNTILRKAAEQGAVHPVYLDRLSSRFAKKIEALTIVPNRNLEREMLHKYCLLVNNYSVKGYSLIIQKTVNQINLNLTSDLSLKSLSDILNISASYLSTLFKKETSMTITDYVNKKRIEYATLLLNTTSMQIQNIAACCGILDNNYFTRIFKKIMGMTPKEYRELITKR